jgi:hypothetical protein
VSRYDDLSTGDFLTDHIVIIHVACESQHRLKSQRRPGLYENVDLYEDCMRRCIRTRVMRLMSGSAYAYAYGRLYIYGLCVSSR